MGDGMNLQQILNQISTALEAIGQKKAYNHCVIWPRYNNRGYCFRKIAECAAALNLPTPEDVPCYDFWTETYAPSELFWKLWTWNLKQDNTEEVLGACLGRERVYEAGTVLGQMASLEKCC
jgi:hypothetical protein